MCSRIENYLHITLPTTTEFLISLTQCSWKWWPSSKNQLPMKDVISLGYLWSEKEKACKSLLTSSQLIWQMKTLDLPLKPISLGSPPARFPPISMKPTHQPKIQQIRELLLIVMSTETLPSLTRVLLLSASTRKLNSTFINWEGLQVGGNQACPQFRHRFSCPSRAPPSCVSPVFTLAGKEL